MNSSRSYGIRKQVNNVGAQAEIGGHRAGVEKVQQLPPDRRAGKEPYIWLIIPAKFVS
jgi:hypothetical protein